MVTYDNWSRCFFSACLLLVCCPDCTADQVKATPILDHQTILQTPEAVLTFSWKICMLRMVKYATQYLPGWILSSKILYKYCTCVWNVRCTCTCTIVASEPIVEENPRKESLLLTLMQINFRVEISEYCVSFFWRKVWTTGPTESTHKNHIVHLLPQGCHSQLLTSCYTL